MSLTADQEQSARLGAVFAARLTLAHKSQTHYTEGPQRWQGIAEKRDPHRGQFPVYSDCSAFATWCLWAGLRYMGTGDVVNGENWTGGYTGTMLEHGTIVEAADAWRGDCVIYGTPGSTGAHTAICVTPGPNPLVISHGSEAGPFLLKYSYRPDVMEVRRYVPFETHPRAAAIIAKAKQLVHHGPMQISVNGLHLIEQFEGFVDHRYADAVGVLTIGYGTTESVISPLPETCTQAEAEGWLRLYVQREVQPMLAAATAAHPLNQNQWDALCSFGYNLGPGYFGASYNLGQYLRAGNHAAVASDMLQFDRAGGEVLQGLVNRRQAEVRLFNTP